MLVLSQSSVRIEHILSSEGAASAMNVHIFRRQRSLLLMTALTRKSFCGGDQLLEACYLHGSFRETCSSSHRWQVALLVGLPLLIALNLLLDGLLLYRLRRFAGSRRFRCVSTARARFCWFGLSLHDNLSCLLRHLRVESCKCK